MDFRFSASNLRTGFAAAVVAGAVHLAQSRDAVVDFTRPLVLGTLRWLGIAAADGGEELRVGKLLVPWTRDCAGINLLLILLALAVWVNRREARAWRFWLCLAAMVPAAAAANVLRVLTLLGYRTLAYPGVESPQTHYFIGFVWLVPFVTLITPRDGRRTGVRLMETLHAAAVVALLAPLAGTPNALLLTLAAVAGLAQCRVAETLSRARAWLLAAWVAAGAGIALVGMESFWLPWLLLCPLVAQERWILSVPGLACVACTHSVLVMQPWSWAVAAAGLAWGWYFGERALGEESALGGENRSYTTYTAYTTDDGRSERAAGDADAEAAAEAAAAAPLVNAGRWGWVAQGVFFACLTLPFLASTVLALGRTGWAPPPGMEARCLSPDCFEVRLRGQPAQIGLACYSSASRDRHHTLAVCLKYRGVEMQEAADCAAVMTDGKNWFREFFMQEGRMLPDYPAYVRSTFYPWRDPGVHLIFVCPCQAQSATDFNAACENLAREFDVEVKSSEAARVAVVRGE